MGGILVPWIRLCKIEKSAFWVFSLSQVYYAVTLSNNRNHTVPLHLAT